MRENNNNKKVRNYFNRNIVDILILEIIRIFGRLFVEFHSLTELYRLHKFQHAIHNYKNSLLLRYRIRYFFHPTLSSTVDFGGSTQPIGIADDKISSCSPASDGGGVTYLSQELLIFTKSSILR